MFRLLLSTLFHLVRAILYVPPSTTAYPYKYVYTVLLTFCRLPLTSWSARSVTRARHLLRPHTPTIMYTHCAPYLPPSAYYFLVGSVRDSSTPPSTTAYPYKYVYTVLLTFCRLPLTSWSARSVTRARHLLRPHTPTIMYTHCAPYLPPSAYYFLVGSVRDSSAPPSTTAYPYKYVYIVLLTFRRLPATSWAARSATRAHHLL